jgi:hypothetical protein
MKRMSGSMVTAMLCAAAVTAQFVSGKATRDALFLTSLDYTALPAMLIATSGCSILLVALNARGSRLIAPSTLVPLCFVVSGLLFLAEWLLRSSSPSLAAVSVYLHVSGAGPLLTSGFWLISSERFDPRTAKKRFGQIAGAGTLGGLLSALAAERVAAVFGAPAMLPLLAALSFASAWLVRRLAGSEPAHPRLNAAAHLAAGPSSSALRVVAETPYLRNLASLVLLGTTSAALVDYLFKAQAVEAFGRGDHLLRFFALYYAATNLLTFVLQTSSSGAVLQRFGLAATTSTPSGALLLGSIGTLIAPGFGALVIARGGESVFRSSLFRTGYELFYTPIPASEKRAAKSLIDVSFDRLGDAVGGGLVRLTVLLAPAAQSSVILWLAMACSTLAILAASRLNRGYIGSLENSLINRAGSIDLSDVEDDSTRALMRSLRRRNNSDTRKAKNQAIRLKAAASGASGTVAAALADADIRDILSLRSRDRERIVEVLGREEGMKASLVPHVIALLAWEPVADHAMFALRKVAEERVGELIDALVDPNQDFAVRRRLARVFSVCVSERAAQGLMLGLDDIRFDVRSQSARSLAAILEKNARIQIPSERIFDVVVREVTVGRPVWESRRLLEGSVNESPLDAFVRDRAGESLAHVFTLLSLVLPREPLQIAFRSLHTDDRQLQGTALEYLEGVLPARIKHRLWPFLERRPAARTVRGREEAIAELLRSNHTIRLNLEEMRRRSRLAAAETV